MNAAAVFPLAIVAGWVLGMIVPTGWIQLVRRRFWLVLHRNGCPLPLNVRRKELLQSYQTRSLGMPWQVEVFDIRATCERCDRTHRLETKTFTQLPTYL